jgi:hypothetical protein
MATTSKRERARRTPQATAAPQEQPASSASGAAQEAHDLRQAINRLAQGIRAQDVTLDIGIINTTAQANAACAMFVALGLCSGEQMDVLILRNVKGMLAELLQQIEQTKLTQKQQAQGLQVVERPKLVVAKH